LLKELVEFSTLIAKYLMETIAVTQVFKANSFFRNDGQHARVKGGLKHCQKYHGKMAKIEIF